MPQTTSPVWLHVRPGAVLLDVHVQPRARRDRIVGEHGAALKIQVAAPPAGGAANRRLTELLAHAFGVPRSAVTVVAGHQGRRKRVTVAGARGLPGGLLE